MVSLQTLIAKEEEEEEEEEEFIRSMSMNEKLFFFSFLSLVQLCKINILCSFVQN